MGAEARLRGWSEVARSRRGALSVGCRNGDSPLRSPAPSPPLFSLSCANAYPSLMISRSSSFPSLWSPSSCFPPTLSLTLSVSFYLFSPHSLLPHSPSFLHLNPCSSLSFLVSASLIFFFRGEYQIHEERKSSPVVGIAAPVKLAALCIKTNSYLSCLGIVLETFTLLILSSSQLLSCTCRSFNISQWHFFLFHSASALN